MNIANGPFVEFPPTALSADLSARSRGRFPRFLGEAMLLLVVVVLAVVAGPPAGHAQQTSAETPAAAAGDAPPPSAAPQNRLMWLIEISGWIGLVILLLSLYFVYVVVRTFLELRDEQDATRIDLEACNAMLAKKDLGGIYKLVKEDPSFFGTVMTEGLSELQYGLDDAREAVDRVGDARTIEFEKRISVLAVLGTLGPMIGLLGTLKGMISSFSAIATSGTQLKADQVARGISEALVLTFEGVLLSVPAIYLYSFFRNRISNVTTSAMLAIHEFLRRVNNQVRASKSA